jgi:hypothetical protein
MPNDKSTIRSRVWGPATFIFAYFQFFPFVVHLPINNNFSLYVAVISVAEISQSTKRIPTGWKVQVSNSDAGEIFRSRPDRH